MNKTAILFAVVLVVGLCSVAYAKHLSSGNATNMPKMTTTDINVDTTAVFYNVSTAGGYYGSGTETHSGTVTNSGTMNNTGAVNNTGQTTMGTAGGAVHSKSATFSNKSGILMYNQRGTRFRVYLNNSTVTVAPR